MPSVISKIMSEISPGNNQTTPEAVHPRLKEYPKNFGDSELQEMIDELLIREFSGVKEIIPVSTFDDQRTGVDRWIETNNGVRFVPDYTSTSDPEKMKRKVRRFLDQPLVRAHDNRGKVTDSIEVPRLVIPVDKIVWGKAYNKFLEGDGGKPTDFLPNADRESLKIAESAVRQIDQLLESMKEKRRPEVLINHVAGKFILVREYFMEQIAFLKKKKALGRAA